jgi:hypothetical protein
MRQAEFGAPTAGAGPDQTRPLRRAAVNAVEQIAAMLKKAAVDIGSAAAVQNHG